MQALNWELLCKYKGYFDDRTDGPDSIAKPCLDGEIKLLSCGIQPGAI